MIDNKTIRKVIMLNKLLPSGSPTYENREASGAVANFTTNTVQPFVKCECEILPIQEGTGTPSPSNPRPISGTDELTLKHDNDNMLVLPTFDFTIQGVRVYTNEDGNVVLNGTSSGGISSNNVLWTNNLRFSLPKGHYYLSVNSFSAYGAVVVVKNTDTGAVICQFHSNWQIDLTETTHMSIGIYIPENTTFDNFVCNFEASFDNSTYDVPNRETYTFDLGQEIMGGTADVVGGSGEVTRVVVTYDGTEDWHSEDTNNFYVSSGRGSGIYYGEDKLLCSHFKSTYSSLGHNNNVYISATGNLNLQCDDITHTADGIKNWCATQYANGTPLQICYELKTPSSFTFDGVSVESLEGVNNVWTDAGSTKVTYKYKTGEGGSSTKKYLPIFYDFYRKEKQS